MPTVAVAQPQEAAHQDAAFEEGIELVLDELRQVGAGGGFDFGEDGRCVLLYPAVQRRLLRAVTLPWSGAPAGARGAAVRWLARVAHVETAARHGLKPSGVPPSPLVVPALWLLPSCRPQGVNGTVDPLQRRTNSLGASSGRSRGPADGRSPTGESDRGLPDHRRSQIDPLLPVVRLLTKYTGHSIVKPSQAGSGRFPMLPEVTSSHST